MCWLMDIMHSNSKSIVFLISLVTTMIPLFAINLILAQSFPIITYRFTYFCVTIFKSTVVLYLILDF